jgi:hypothetical protein
MNYGEKRVMGKTYWGVESVYGAGGAFVSARLFGRFGEAKPYNKRRSRENGVVFGDWFETEEEAVAYLEDVRGCADAERAR